MKTKRTKFLSFLLVIAITVMMFPLSSFAAGEVDLTANGSNAVINGAYWQNLIPHLDATGTGTFNSFLRVQASGTERGHNGDQSPAFDEKDSFTDSEYLSNVPTVYLTGDPTPYREFQLDINENDEFISLDRFQVWVTNNASLTGYNLSTYSFPTGAALVYDMVGSSIKMKYDAGSGKREYRVLVPQSMFDGKTGQYVVLFTEHGITHSSSSGFEEWGVRVATEAPPSINVVKTALTTSLPEPGGWVTFKVEISNTSNSTDPITFASLTDRIGSGAPYSISGSIYNESSLTTPTAFPFTVASGDTKTVYFKAMVSGDAGATVTDTVTASGQDDEGTPVSDSDDAVVTITNVKPTIDVTKTASVSTLPETGGPVTFTFRITNTSIESVTVTSILDDQFGNLLATAKAQNGGNDIVIPATNPDSYYEFTYATTLFSNTLTAHVNRVDVIAVDNDGSSATDYDTETVNFTNVAPVIDVTKTASTNTLPETGGPVTFTFRITNTGTEAVTVTSILDDKFGNLLATAKAQNGGNDIVIPATNPDSFYTFTYAATLSSNTLTPHTNRVDVIAIDNDGTTVTDFDTETVTFTNVAPVIDVTKTASTNSLPETGGPVTFTFRITNTGTETVTVTSIIDDVFGDLLPAAELQNGNEDIILAPAAHFDFTYATTLASDLLVPHVNRVDVIAEDNDGLEATDFDTETVRFTNVAPTIDVTKTASTNTLPETGGPVTFTFRIANTGTETVTVTSILDDKFGSLLVAAVAQNGGNDIVIAPAAYYEFTFETTLASDSLTAHTNRVDVIAVDNDGSTATDFDTETVTFTDVAPAVTIDKTANPTFVPETGGDVTFTFVIENTGTETVLVTSLIDNVYGDLLAEAERQNGSAAIELDPTETYSFAITRTLSSTDLIDHVNTITVIAIDNEETPATDSDDATVAFSAIRLEKSGAFDAGEDGFADAGELITFTFTVTNPGKIDLTNVVITDPMIDNIVYVSGDTNEDEKLQNSETWIFSGTYAVTQVDIDAGVVNNTAVASSNETDDDTDSETVVLEQSAAITIEKKVANLSQDGVFGELVEFDEGETAVYSIIITNTGNVTLYDVILSDSEVAPGTEVEFDGGGTAVFDENSEINLGMMEPGDVIALYYTYDTVFADIARSTIINVATVTGTTDETGENENADEVSAFDDAAIDVVAIPLGLSAIKITKQVKNETAGGAYADLANGFIGDKFSYIITVTNTGSTKLSNVILTDNKVAIGTAVLINGGPSVGAWINIGGVASIVIGDMESGASVSYSYSYNSVASDEGDTIINSAIVNAFYIPEREGYENVPLTDDASAAITVVGIPITGETGSSTAIGLAFILAGVVALILRRRHGKKQMDI